MRTRSITIIVPVYNEQDALAALLGEIRAVAGTQGYDCRVLFVDDGSTDGSWRVIEGLAAGDAKVAGLRFRRNAGKAAALMAGFAEAEGELVITMDADLQDPPVEIPKLIAQIDAGYDVVSGWKRHRYDPWHKVLPSRVFNKIISAFTGVRLHDHVCGLKCYRRPVLSDLRIYGELHRFLAVFAAAAGHRVTEVPTLHRPRTTGVGKYGLERFAKGFLDLITVTVLTRFRWRPQHLIGGIGLYLIAGLPVVLAAGLGLYRLWAPMGLAALIGLVGIAAGLHLIAAGLTAELIVAERPIGSLYEVTARIGWCAGRNRVDPFDPVPLRHDEPA